MQRQSAGGGQAAQVLVLGLRGPLQQVIRRRKQGAACTQVQVPGAEDVADPGG